MPAASVTDVTFSSPSVLVPMLILLGVAVVIVGVGFLLETTWVRSTVLRRWNGHRVPPYAAVSVFAAILVLFPGTLVTVSVTAVTHTAAVTDWVNDEYGITVSTDSTTGLLNGEERVVDVDGAPTRIEFVETNSGHIAIYEVTTGQLIEPAGK